jgi:hypothetical protein
MPVLNIEQQFRFVLPIVLVLGSFTAGVGVAAAAVAHPSPPPGTCDPIVNFSAANFDRSTKIDNPFLPLQPGTQLTWAGQVAGQPHTVVFTVTDVVKPIDGVHTLAIWDRDFDGKILAEDELSFFAQDRAGNVWNLGEYPEEFENRKFTGAPNTWISGQNASGGIHMLANPPRQTRRYLQGYSPSINFLDCAQVIAKNQSVCVPLRCFNDDVLVTDENSPLSDNPTAHQHKFYAYGVGIVKIAAVDDPEGEDLALTKLTHLDAAGLAAAQRAALRLDKRGYVNSVVYRQTLPAYPCERGSYGDCPNL